MRREVQSDGSEICHLLFGLGGGVPYVLWIGANVYLVTSGDTGKIVGGAISTAAQACVTLSALVCAIAGAKHSKSPSATEEGQSLVANDSLFQPAPVVADFSSRFTPMGTLIVSKSSASR